MFPSRQDLEKKWIGAYTKHGALWISDQNPLRPHPVLRSGLHSNGFFNSRLLISDEGLLATAAFDLNLLFMQEMITKTVHGVVGPKTGATVLSRLLSEVITLTTEKPCFWMSPSKHEEGGEVVSMEFTDEERTGLSGKTILLCEDVITTGGSVERTAKSVIEAGGIPLPFVLLLVNRSRQPMVNGKKVVALINNLDEHILTWKPEECPFCKQGSEALENAKESEKWARLTANY